MSKKRTKYAIHKDFKFFEKLNPPLGRVSLPIIVTLMRLFIRGAKKNKLIKVEKYKIPFENHKPIKAILYSPKDIEPNAPCLVYYHGGGFVLPPAPYHYEYCVQYALGAKCKVLFVDYPLAPKYKFPIPTNACYKAYCWLIDNAKNLGIDSSRVAVGGDSAGGNISAVVCFMANDKQTTTPPLAQLLIYPAIGTRKPTHSMKIYTDTPMCNSVDYKKYSKLYFVSDEQMMSERYASPLNSTNLKMFPTSYIETAEFDCLRDEAILFARLLKKEGIKVVLNNTKGTIHGYDIVQKSSISKNSVKKRIQFLNNIFNG